MRARHLKSCAVTLLMLSLITLQPAAQTPGLSADDFFNADVVHDITLWLHEDDWAKLTANYLENDYYPARFEWRGQVLQNVGIRSAGLGTRNPRKPGLRADFNKNVTGQEFLGMGSVRLDNTWSDPAMLRDRLSMLLINRMGQPASRVAPARLFVNGEYRGLYAVIESIDKPYLMRNLGESGGYLFEYDWRGNVFLNLNQPFDFRYLGPDLRLYEKLFDPKTHEHEPLHNRYEPIREMVRTMDDRLGLDFKTAMAPYVNLRRFMTYLALESFLAENDGILGFNGMANFYLYRFQGTKQHQFLAWDRDSTFHTLDRSIWHRINDNVLVRESLKDPELRNAYLVALLQSAAAAGPDPVPPPDPRAAPLDYASRTCPPPPGQPPCGWLEQEIDRGYNVIRQAARQDSFKQFSNEEFENAVLFLRQFARERSDVVRREVVQAGAAAR